MRSLLLMLGVVFVGAASGCHKKKDSGPPRVNDSCTLACDRVIECHPEVDVETCEEDCLGSFSPYAKSLRDEYLVEWEQCMTDVACDDLGESALSNGCRSDARDRVGPNLMVVKACDTLSQTLVRCIGSGLKDDTACLATMKIFDDATLKKAIQCDQHSKCTEISHCFAESVGYVPIMSPKD